MPTLKVNSWLCWRKFIVHTEQPWIPIKSEGKWAKGFCRIMQECLEEAGVLNRCATRGWPWGLWTSPPHFWCSQFQRTRECWSSRRWRFTASRVIPWRRTRFVHGGHWRRFATSSVRDSRVHHSVYYCRQSTTLAAGTQTTVVASIIAAVVAAIITSIPVVVATIGSAVAVITSIRSTITLS
jgi:hypothetical protein